LSLNITLESTLSLIKEFKGAKHCSRISEFAAKSVDQVEEYSPKPWAMDAVYEEVEGIVDDKEKVQEDLNLLQIMLTKLKNSLLNLDPQVQ
jgi:hypothetical protein